MVNGVVSIISFSVLSLFVNRNSIYLCVLILYPAILPNTLMSSNSFLVVSLRFSRYSIMSSANSDSFTSFPNWIPFIYFSSLIAVVRTYKTMLNNTGESGHPCIVPDLNGNAFSFSPLRMMLAMGLSSMAFIMLRQIPSVPTF
uniref:Uncharacterized protein n=1 Tax=Sus scrofa TaxID=9823 RepID=A0A8D1J3H1_PIG